MNIAIQTGSWGPEKNRQHLPEVLADVIAAGYAGIEVGAQHLDLGAAREFRALVARYGLRVAAIHVGAEIHDPIAVEAARLDLERSIGFAADVGATFLALSGQPKEGKSVAEFRIEAENLNRLGQLCCNRGLQLAYHNHSWEIQNRCRELHILCEHTDASLVALCLDVAWIYRAGADPADVIGEFVNRLAYLHVKDTTDDEWMELGNGKVDLPAVFRATEGRIWPWLVVEQDETKRGAAVSARISRDYLKRTLGI